MRRFISNLVFVLWIAVTCVSCSRHAVNLEGAEGGVKEKIFSVWGSWIKEEGNNYDIGLNLENGTHNDALIVMIHDILCFRGNLRGELRHTFFNTGERTIDLLPGERKKFNAVCDLGQENEGHYKIVVRRVYLNANRDGKTTGNIVAQDIEWLVKVEK